MPRMTLTFLPDDGSPADEQLLLQLVYGLCSCLRNQGEERCKVFVTREGIPYPEVRRLCKLLISKLDLPVPLDRVDEWVNWERTNQCWIVSDEMAAEADRLSTLT